MIFYLLFFPTPQNIKNNIKIHHKKYSQYLCQKKHIINVIYIVLYYLTTEHALLKLGTFLKTFPQKTSKTSHGFLH